MNKMDKHAETRLNQKQNVMLIFISFSETNVSFEKQLFHEFNTH